MGADSTKLPKLVCMHVLKGLALSRTSHSSEICTLEAAPAIFKQLVATVAKNTSGFITPTNY
jgi:hypothetical protein